MPQFSSQTSETKHLMSSCTQWLSGHRPLSPRERLMELASSEWAEAPADLYGEGPALGALEESVAHLLGKEAALFVHKGVAAQLMALQVWTERASNRRVALHRKSHIEADESHAYERLLGLQGVRLGSDHAHFQVSDLEQCGETLGVVTLELPLRRAGFLLPSWSELTAIAGFCRSRRIPLHIDGARIWESTPYYNRSLEDVAALGDSVYVSFYKGLGGLAGSILAGSRDFIEASRIWKTRLAGNIFTQFPYVLAAHEGLRLHLPRMNEYHSRAVELAAALSRIEGMKVLPDPPHTNSFQVLLPARPEDLRKASHEFARKKGFWLFGNCQATALPHLSMIEVVIGSAHEGWTTDEAVAAFRTLLQLSPLGKPLV